MRIRFRVIASVVVSGSAILLSGCTGERPVDVDQQLESSATESASPAESIRSTQQTVAPETEAIPEVGSAEAISVCGDALYYFYLDGTFNDRFNLNSVKVEGARYVFENQSDNFDYLPGHPYASDPALSAYVDGLVADNDADIWCEQASNNTFDVGFIGGESQTAVTMEELQLQFDAADQKIRELSGLS